MKAAFKTLLLAALTAAGMSFCGLAVARDDVYWSVGIAAPGYPVGVGVALGNGPVVYSQPAYWGPPAVVYGPPVIYGPGYYPYYPYYPYYLRPGPLYLQPGPVYYGPRWRHGRHR